MEKPKTTKARYDVDEDRREELRRFETEDPYAERFFVFFDMLRLRGVDAGQSARTAHLIASDLKLQSDIEKAKEERDYDFARMLPGGPGGSK